MDGTEMTTWLSPGGRRHHEYYDKSPLSILFVRSKDRKQCKMSYGWEGDTVVKKWFCMNFSIAETPSQQLLCNYLISPMVQLYYKIESDSYLVRICMA